MVEHVDIVDENDNVIRSAAWEEMMSKSLLHRSANIIVFNSKGEIFVHRRQKNLMLYPGLYDVKFGGSVRAGESYEEAAKRELLEEANIKNAELEFLFTSKFRSKDNNVNRKVFKCTHDNKITLDKEEVFDGKFMKIDEIKKLQKNKKLSPSAESVFEEFLKR
ncbi:MAG: NUDIX domain-containing protein [Nanoarchaeota archaeon]|nr:MAG: NUDIX domain-containing protein [Nanoarchaeota archaeon]